MKEKIEMRTISPEIRKNNFDEVALGYNDEEALNEANRCLNCQNPRCVLGCPVHIEIPKFIAAIKNNELEKAYEIIQKSSNLPGVCGRVCPQEKQCESFCIRDFKGDAISIGALERYVSDYALKNNLCIKNEIKKNGLNVAIIGSGPSGLSCAGDLAKMGYDVTVYEAFHKLGGVLAYGIPKFRLPEKILQNEIESLIKLGVKFETNVVLGKTITLDDLKEQYKAIYIATGAGLPKFMGIENELANGVFSANEILTRINLMEAYKENAKTPIINANNVIVVGGGNVALDAARSMLRLSSNVTVVYRRDEESLPARKLEIEHAKEEGIKFLFLTNPKSILVDENNNVTGLKVVNMELTGNDNNGKKEIKEKDNSEYIINCDAVIMALGTKPNKVLIQNSNIDADKDGHIIVNDGKTNLDMVYAGGDAVTGSATVILAMEAGRNAALKINERLSGNYEN